MVLYQRFYGVWPTNVIVYIILGLLLWTGIILLKQRYLKERFSWIWTLLCALILAVFLYFIFDMTIFGRASGERVLILQPFRNLALALHDSELYRSIVMNTALFVPVGMALPFLFPAQWKAPLRFLLCGCFSLLLSAGIEFIQYQYGLGDAEVDDLICNTLGGLIGAVPFLFSAYFGRKL